MEPHPLFQEIIFARVAKKEEMLILQTRGVLAMSGDAPGTVSMRESDIDLLRTAALHRSLTRIKMRPQGPRVRIDKGVLKGAEGILVGKHRSHKLAMHIACINQWFGICVNEDDLGSCSACANQNVVEEFPLKMISSFK